MSIKTLTPHYPTLDASDLFRRQATVPFIGMSIGLKAANKQRHEAAGAPVAVCFHWSAGDWDDVYDDYRFGVVWNNVSRQTGLIKTLDWKEKEQAVWGRNTGVVNIGFAGMMDAYQDAASNLVTGPRPLNTDMITLGALIGAEVCAWKRIDPRAKITVPEKRPNADMTQLIPTGRMIKVPTVWDHAGWAKVDGYARHRWDIHKYQPEVNKRLLEFYDELKARTRQFQFETFLK